MTLSTRKRKALSDLDIDTWYPRVILPNSPIPCLIEEPSSNKSTVASVEKKSLDPSTPALKAVQYHQIQTANVVDSAPAITRNLGAVEYDEPIRFGLELYVVDKFFVASALATGYEHQEQSALRLLQQILFAMTGSEFEAVAHQHKLYWPLFNNEHAGRGVNSAKIHLHEMFSEIVRQHAPDYFISFGGVLPKIFDWKSANGSDFGLKRIALPSLYKMLTNTQSKSKAWELIKQHYFERR